VHTTGVAAAERDFQARFGKLVAAARYSKKDSKEAEAGMLALDALHKQVMPFILRRTKAQVLQDLPPKIVTDVMCGLSPIQHALYEDFQESQALTEVKSTLAAAVAAEGGSNGSASSSGKGAQHVFSALLYLRKLCSHPLLALDWSVPAHREACQQVLGVSTQAAAEQVLRGLEHAPKLLALQDILVQCGLVNGLGSSGTAAAGEADLSEGSSDSGHRLLVFAQLKGMLDLVENLVLQPLGVSSLRLDGSVEASARFGVVQRFNTDPTIQVSSVEPGGRPLHFVRVLAGAVARADAGSLLVTNRLGRAGCSQAVVCLALKY
jgi:TATA-binding protein-associated factor